MAERWNGTAWSVLPVPVPAGTADGNLLGISCTSATACTAVGHYQISSGAMRTLAEFWDGTSWSVQPTPNRGHGLNELLGVSCPRPGACTAVGTYITSTGVQVPLAEAWDGTSWSVQGTTVNPPGASFSMLLGVACATPATCTGAGLSDTPPDSLGESASRTLAEAEP
jgi:hypothetical protein